MHRYFVLLVWSQETTLEANASNTNVWFMMVWLLVIWSKQGVCCVYLRVLILLLTCHEPWLMITSLCWTVSQYWVVSGEMIFTTQCRATNIKHYLQRRKSRRREEIYLVQWSLILCVWFYLKWKCMSTAAVSGLIVSDCVSPLVTTVSPWQHSSWLSLSLHQPLTCEQTMLTRSGACIALQNIVAITKHKWSLYKLCVWQSVFLFSLPCILMYLHLLLSCRRCCSCCRYQGWQWHQWCKWQVRCRAEESLLVDAFMN